MKTAAIYARVSSDKQKEENTIASQTAALTAFAAEQGYAVPTEWIFEDEGYSGASLIRPGLERVRDLAAEGELDAVLVYAPDRLSRRYAYQILLIEELARAGVETLFIRSPRATTAEDQLLLQFQGMIRNTSGRRSSNVRVAASDIAPDKGRSACSAARRSGTAMFARASSRRRITRSTRWRRRSFDGCTSAIPLTVSASVRSPVCSMSSGSRRASKPVAGNARRSGPCCVTPPIKAPLASARHRPRHGNASPGRYACVAVLRRVTVHTLSGPTTRGSRFQCRRSSMSRPSPSPRSVWKPTRRTHRAGLSCPALCRAWCAVPTAATRSTGHRRAQARARSITIAVSAPMPGAGSADRFAIAARSAKIFSIGSHGPRSSSCSKSPA